MKTSVTNIVRANIVDHQLRTTQTILRTLVWLIASHRRPCMPRWVAILKLTHEGRSTARKRSLSGSRCPAYHDMISRTNGDFLPNYQTRATSRENISARSPRNVLPDDSRRYCVGPCDTAEILLPCGHLDFESAVTVHSGEFKGSFHGFSLRPRNWILGLDTYW